MCLGWYNVAQGHPVSSLPRAAESFQHHLQVPRREMKWWESFLCAFLFSLPPREAVLPPAGCSVAWLTRKSCPSAEAEEAAVAVRRERKRIPRPHLSENTSGCLLAFAGRQAGTSSVSSLGSANQVAARGKKRRRTMAPSPAPTAPGPEAAGWGPCLDLKFPARGPTSVLALKAL